MRSRLTPQERAQNYQAANLLLIEAQRLLGDEMEAASIGHLARACRIRGVMLDATVVVELPEMKPQRFTVRQDAGSGDMILTEQATGAKRTITLAGYAQHQDLDRAWRAAGQG